MTAAIDLRDVFRVYATPEGDAAALQGLTLSVRSGEVLAVLGPSGAGKTTLLRVLAGLERPSAGTARVLGRDLAKLGGRARARFRAEVVGYVDQRHGIALDPALPILASVATRLRLDLDPAGRDRAAELLTAVGLGSRLEALPSELSGGERQRAAVCAALAHRPRLVLADEPTGELDRASADRVLALLVDLARADGATVVVVSHDPATADAADRTVWIRDGRISEERSGADETLVVGRGGWLRLPEELLRGAGIGERVTARLEERRIAVAAAGPTTATPATAAAEPAAAPARGAVVELRGVRKAHGARVVLDGFSTSIAGNALTAVTGPSGSGKTTLLDLVVGLERPDAGAVLLEGEDVTGRDRAAWAALRASRIGYVPQQPALVPFLSARENVELVLRLRDRAGDALETLALVGLAERANQLVGRLSGGERLRVAIARALASDPVVLVADEPTARLDEANAHAVAALLGRLARVTGAAVLVASHDPVVVAKADAQVALG